jgi:hypothetical protein
MVEVTALFPMLAYFDQEITSYNHRFTLWMVDVVRDDDVREQLLNEQILVYFVFMCLLPSCALDVDTASLLIDHLIVQYVGFSNGDVFHFCDDTLLSVIQLETLAPFSTHRFV